jgi:hypothetical protein
MAFGNSMSPIGKFRKLAIVEQKGYEGKGSRIDAMPRIKPHTTCRKAGSQAANRMSLPA